MARPLRIEYAGACYHVTCRGNMGQRVFFSDKHYGLFMEKLQEFTGLFHVSIRCYCLMPNHVHLYLQTHEGNLSRFMQSFLTSFCVSLNRMRRKSGHIFQGRFKSHLVQDELYRSKLSRYIHLNPVRIRSIKDLPAQKKLELLNGFRWSSYLAYAGLETVPEWLEVSHVMSTWGVDAGSRRRAYRNYVEAGLRKGVEGLWDEVKEQHVLGEEKFLENVRRSLLAVPLKAGDVKERRTLGRLKCGFCFEDVLGAVVQATGIKEEDILRRHAKCAIARKLLMYCLCKYCRSSVGIASLAARLSVSRSGLLIAKDRCEKLLGKDNVLRCQLAQVDDLLGKSFS